MNITQKLALGAAAGVAATFVMQGMLEGGGKLIPDGVPPIKSDPGQFMIDKAKAVIPIPPKIEPLAAKSLHLGYGITAGVLWALLPHSRWKTLEGALLGLGVWAAGYLGWLPATKLMPPITQQTAKQIAVPVVEHAIFGVAVAKAFEAMEPRAA
jgi:hypothetical protein